MKPEIFSEEILPLLNSPDVKGYAVGLTKNVKSRRSSYKFKSKPGWKSLYVILDNLTQEESLKFEEKYFNWLTKDKRKIFYKKYHPGKRDESHRKSVGGSPSNNENEYSIYVACY